MSKITSTEFEKWSDLLWADFIQLLTSPKFKNFPPERQEMGQKILSLLKVQVSCGSHFDAFLLPECLNFL